jgi:hypothetical protein
MMKFSLRIFAPPLLTTFGMRANLSLTLRLFAASCPVTVAGALLHMACQLAFPSPLLLSPIHDINAKFQHSLLYHSVTAIDPLLKLYLRRGRMWQVENASPTLLASAYCIRRPPAPSNMLHQLSTFLTSGKLSSHAPRETPSGQPFCSCHQLTHCQFLCVRRNLSAAKRWRSRSLSISSDAPCECNHRQ